MYKKVLAMILTLCLVAGMMPAMVFADDTGGLTVEDIDPGSGSLKYIFANGNAITIEAKGSGSIIKDANGQELTPSGFTNDADDGYDLSNVIICGGSKGGCTPASGSTSITVNGGSIGGIIGGCYEGTLTGNVNIVINGGTVNNCSKTYSSSPFTNLSFVGGSVGPNSKVTGDVHISITAGTITGKGVVGGIGAKVSGWDRNSGIGNAYLSIIGGNFISGFINYIPSGCYGTYAGALYIYTNTQNKLPSDLISPNDFNTNQSPNTYMLTNDEFVGTHPAAINSSDYSSDNAYFIKIDDTNKKYQFIPGSTSTPLTPQIFENYTIPQGYVMEIPTGVTLTVNSGVDVTNNGTISIRGTLLNNGSITGNGYIFKRAEGVYTPGAGAFPTFDEVQFQIDPIATLTIEKGDIRGTAKITNIFAETNCTYYYRVYGSEPIPPKAGDTFNAQGFTEVSKNAEFPAFLNGVTAVYEIKGGKVQKYSAVPMTDENLCGLTNYDALDTAIVSQGEKDNTTKITASADTGNTLYYKLSDSVQGSGYVYNTRVEPSALTKVVSGADIAAEAGKYISVYEMDTNGYLKKFVSVQLTASNFSPYSGGLVADTVNKRIYCNGAKVAYTSASSGDYCQLYVYTDGQWKATVPRNLNFVSGAGFKDYTLYGGSAADSPETGTLYMLTILATASKYIPKGAEGFANYIIPDLARSATKWDQRYLVKGTIDLNNCPYSHFWDYSWSRCYIQSLTLKDNAQLTLNTGDGPKFIMMGKYTDIVKGENATITNIQQLIFTPYVDIKLFDKEGKEFSKDSESGKYQIPKDAQVTIAGAVSLKGAVALFGDAQQPVSAAPQYIKEPYDEDFTDYSIGFYSNDTHKYYTGDDVKRKIEGTGENAVRRVQVTLPNFNDYSGWNIELRNYNGDTVEGCKYGAINTSISFDLGKSAILPPAPTSGVVDDTANTFTFAAATGYDAASLYEYSTDGGTNWNDCTDFIINVGNIAVTAGNVQVRLKSTDEYNSGNVLSSTQAFTAELEGTVSITGDARVGETLTAETQDTQLGAVLHYQWKSGGVNIGADKNTYTAVGSDIGKTITVTVNATADGYTGELASSSTDAVAKGSAQTLNSGTLNISNRLEQAYKFNLKSLLTNGVDFGNVSYSVVSGNATNYYPAVTDSNISNGILTITVGNVASNEEKSVGTITVKITSQYYEDMQADININSTNKMVPTTEVMGVFHYVYGEKMSDRGITGSATHNGNPVYGKFVWTAPDYKVNVSDTSAKWRFIPGDTEKYVGTEGIADIVVSKATLSGTPLFTVIKEAGKKLSEVAPTAPANWPSGSFAWADSADTVVAANTAYNWIFTPDDTDNYNVLAGTVTPYTVSSGGNSSGDSSSSQTSSGGSSSGHHSGGSSTATTASTAKTNTSSLPTQASTTVTPTVTNGTANITVAQNTVAEAIKKAQEEAKKNGNEKSGIAVEIKVETTNSNASTLNANLPKEAVDELIKEQVKEFGINSDSGKMELDLETLKAIQKQVGADVNVSAKKVDSSTLSAEAKAIVGNRPVFDFAITGANGTKVTNFGDGKITVSIPYTLGENEKAGNVVAYYIDNEGKVQEMPNCVYDEKTKTLSFVTNHFSLYAVGYKAEVSAINETAFTDIGNHWAKEEIEFVTAKGLFSGTAQGKFSPNGSMTRGMFVTVLGRLAKADGSSYTNSSFTDVKANAYYKPYIQWAGEKGIAKGVSETTFAPNQSITREQMAVIMVSYAKATGFELPQVNKENTFADNEQISSYAKEAVKQMQMAGVLTGKKDNKFDPKGTATRAEVSAVIKRFAELVEKK